MNNVIDLSLIFGHITSHSVTELLSGIDAEDITFIQDFVKTNTAEKGSVYTLSCANSQLHRFSSEVLSGLFEVLLPSFDALDISGNQLCCNNKPNVSAYLFSQDNKLWDICQCAAHCTNLNIANNDLHRLTQVSLQKLQGRLPNLHVLVVSMDEIRRMTIGQIDALAGMCPHLREITFVDAVGRVLESSEYTKSALARHFILCLQKEPHHSGPGFASSGI